MKIYGNSNNNSSQKIPIILCIDVEPNGMFIDRTRKLLWTGYEKAYSFFTEIRPKLASATGSQAHYSWFYRMDPQISDTYGSGSWPVEYYSEYINEIIKNSDEVGIHTHFYRFSDQKNNWIIDNKDPDWMGHCIKTSYEAFKETFTRTCLSHRFGDRIVTDTALTLVKNMGSQFDLTFEPGFDEIPSYSIRKRITGPLPKMEDIPQKPFIYTSTDLHEPDSKNNKDLWLIPLSTGKIRSDIFRLLGIKSSLTLHLGIKPQFFQKISENLLKILDKPYLGLVLKTDMFLNRRMAKNITNNLKYLTTHPNAKQFIFSTPEETMKILEFM